jgi:hypothetical protein
METLLYYIIKVGLIITIVGLTVLAVLKVQIIVWGRTLKKIGLTRESERL